jgi:hypothetical protein
MKATLEFTLPEEQEEYQICNRFMDWALALQEMDNWFRNRLKYGDDFKGGREELEMARQAFFDILEERDLNLGMIR